MNNPQTRRRFLQTSVGAAGLTLWGPQLGPWLAADEKPSEKPREKLPIAAVVSSVDRPVNVVIGLQGVQLSLAALSEIGVKRIKVGSALSRAALGAFLRAAREMQEHGTFSFAEDAVSYRDISTMFNV